MSSPLVGAAGLHHARAGSHLSLWSDVLYCVQVHRGRRVCAGTKQADRAATTRLPVLLHCLAEDSAENLQERRLTSGSCDR